MDGSRIEELRRRIQKDPASIAFAQLAEEYRRAGDHEEAVRVCRAGLERHPGYVSAHVTLGRALMDLGRLEEAHGEFEQVLRTAPDNLIALSAMADLHQRGVDEMRLERMLSSVPPSEAPAVEMTSSEQEGIGLALPPEIPDYHTVDLAPVEATALETPPIDSSLVETTPIETTPPQLLPADPALLELERWLDGILTDRDTRPAGPSDPELP